MGFVVSEEGLKMDPNKMQAILSWSIPRNAYEVRNFRGLSSFYRKFIRNFSQICAPIIATSRESRQPFKRIKAVDKNLNY